jgi:prophage regulatory protein
MRVLSLPQLKSEKGIKFSRQHLDRLMRAKLFPRPIKLGENTNGWIEDEIDAYLIDRIKKRDQSAHAKAA